MSFTQYYTQNKETRTESTENVHYQLTRLVDFKLCVYLEDVVILCPSFFHWTVGSLNMWSTVYLHCRTASFPRTTRRSWGGSTILVLSGDTKRHSWLILLPYCGTIPYTVRDEMSGMDRVVRNVCLWMFSRFLKDFFPPCGNMSMHFKSIVICFCWRDLLL